MKKFTIEKIGGLVMIVSRGNVYATFDEAEFTERKLNNAKKRLEKNFCGNVEFEKKF